MRGSIGFRTGLLGGILAVTAALAGNDACAQRITGQGAEQFRVPSGIGATVSVATLRIPQAAWKHFARAKAALAHNRTDELERETDKAIAIAPDFAQAYLLRAHAKLQSHDFEAAISDVREARRAEPNVMWASMVLAGAYNGLQRYDDARRVLAELRGPEAQTWQAAYEGARAAIGLNDVETALHLSAAALASAPEDFPDVHLVRTNAFLRAGRWSDAREQLELYLQSKGSEMHRSEALTALENVKQQIRNDELKDKRKDELQRVAAR